MKINELRQKTGNELQMLLKENRAKLHQLKFDLVSRKLKNTNQLKIVRREIARILTITRQEKKI